VLRFRPRSCCFMVMGVLSGLPNLHAIGTCSGF
jgi:hypothetical protein